MTCLFILTYFTIGIAVSTSTAKARTSIVVILIIWVALQLIIPKMSDMVARLVYPVRTQTEVSLEKSLLKRSIDTEMAKELGQQNAAIFSNVPAAVAKNPDSPERKKWDAVRSEIEQKARDRKATQLGAIDETHQQQKRRQQNLAVNLSLISPSAAFAQFIADVCSTGELERAKYIEAARAHQKALDNELFSKVKRTYMLFPNGQAALAFDAKPIDPQKLPKFSIAPTSIAETFKVNWRSLFSLILWLVAPFATAYVRFLKYDVR